jgi:ABC-type sugar transport system substrate-binding protein
METLKEFPGVEVVKVVENNLDGVLNFYRTRSLLKEFPQLAGIYCASARCETTAREVEKQNLAGKVKLVYHDCSPEIQTLMDKRVIQATILQHREEQSYLALRLLYDHFIENKPLFVGQRMLEPCVLIRGMKPGASPCGNGENGKERW